MKLHEKNLQQNQITLNSKNLFVYGRLELWSNTQTGLNMNRLLEHCHIVCSVCYNPSLKYIFPKHSFSFC